MNNEPQSPEIDTMSDLKDHVCDDCRFSHLADSAVRYYLSELVEYLDDFDATCGALHQEEWRTIIGLERSGI